MDAHTEKKIGLANNLALQIGLLVMAAIVIVAVAWKFM
jgi:hypothetical protein